MQAILIYECYCKNTNIFANSKIYNKDTLKAFSLKTEIGHNV